MTDSKHSQLYKKNAQKALQHVMASSFVLMGPPSGAQFPWPSSTVFVPGHTLSTSITALMSLWNAALYGKRGIQRFSGC